jgi:hypothetical protein
MTRDMMKAFFDLAWKVGDALASLPYRDAVGPLHDLQEMRDIVGEELPGGYAGTCPHCEEVKGEDELVDCGDERICQTCVAAWDEKAKA